MKVIIAAVKSRLKVKNSEVVKEKIPQNFGEKNKKLKFKERWKTWTEPEQDVEILIKNNERVLKS